MPTALLTAPNVRAALAALRGAEPLRASALLDLHLVVEHLQREGLPDTIAGREWALGRVLTETVASQLSITPTDPTHADDDAPHAGLERALRTGDLDAQAWWMLWLRFLDGRGVSAAEVARGLGVTPRTLQRRVHRGCRQLAARLHEREARLDARDRSRESAYGAASPSTTAHAPHPTEQPEAQLAHPTPADSPPAPAQLAAVAPLPHKHDPFIERSGLHATLTGLCRAHRLVTLMGPGGAGKTRMAVQIADELGAPGGPLHPVSYVALDGLAPQESVAEGLCRTLGVEVRRGGEPGEGGESVHQAVVRGLTARGGLLVLDNCEHVVAPVAELVALLLERCPNLRVLATSRRPLDLAAEQRVPLGAMTLPDADDAAAWARSEAVALFLARARAVAPRFEIDANTGPLVARICHAVDGLPLAIEIVAAALEHQSLPMLAASIEQTLPSLDHPRRDLPDRQRSVAATVRWSTTQLTREQRRGLAALAVFEGGFTAQAAAAVLATASVPDAPALLRTLVRRSLLVPPAPSGGRRYRLLRPVRAVVREMLEDDAARLAVADAHAAHLAAWLTELMPQLQGERAAHALAEIDAGAADALAALAHARRRDGEQALRIAGALAAYWLQRGHIRTGRRALEEVLGDASATTTGPRASALIGLARLARQASDLPAAAHALDEAIDLLRTTDDLRATADALRELGTVREQQEDAAGAEAVYHESLALYQARGATFGEAAVRNNMGLLQHHRGDFEAAGTWLADSLQLFRAIDARRETGIVLANLANVQGDRGDLELAAASYDEALAIAHDVEDPAGAAAILPSRAWLRLQQGDVEGAAEDLAAAIPALLQVEDRRKAGEWLSCAAGWLERVGAVEPAWIALSAESALRTRIRVDVLPKERDERTALTARLAARATPRQCTAWQEVAASLPWQEALVRTLRAVQRARQDRSASQAEGATEPSAPYRASGAGRPNQGSTSVARTVPSGEPDGA